LGYSRVSLEAAVFSSNVQPKRRVREKNAAWTCACPQRDGSFKQNFGFLLYCAVCGVRRHESVAAEASL
jgi:hypothetical protein